MAKEGVSVAAMPKPDFEFPRPSSYLEAYWDEIDLYQPWIQVKTYRKGKKLEIVDEYKPPVQLGVGKKLVAENVPGGGSGDSYVVGALDARVPQSTIFSGAASDIMWAWQIDREASFDRTFTNVHAGYAMPEIVREWRKRMGVMRVENQERPKIIVKEDFEIVLEDVSNKREGSGLKERMEVGYALVLLSHNLRFIEDFELGKRVYMEVVVGRKTRHLVGVERTKLGVRAWRRTDNLARAIGYDLGLGNEAIKVDKYALWSLVLEKAAELCYESVDDVASKLITLKVTMPDDRDSIAEMKEQSIWAMEEGLISVTHTNEGKVVYRNEAHATKIFPRFARLVSMNPPRKFVRGMFDNDKKPTGTRMWEVLRLDPDNEEDVKIAIIIARMAGLFWGLSDDQKPIVEAFYKYNKSWYLGKWE